MYRSAIYSDKWLDLVVSVMASTIRPGVPLVNL
jgi:hypothetical protein